MNGFRKVINNISIIFVIASVFLLLNCGGGGGGSTTEPQDSYSAGGSVYGLDGPGLMLWLNGAEELNISGNGPFTFSTPLEDGSSYDADILSQPDNPLQLCEISNGQGTVSGENITDITVRCPYQYFTNAGALIEYPSIGDVLMSITEADDVGSIKLFGCIAGEKINYAGIDVEGIDEMFNVSINSDGLPETITLPDNVIVTFTYNADDTFNFTLIQNDEIIYSADNLISDEDFNTSIAAAAAPMNVDEKLEKVNQIIDKYILQRCHESGADDPSIPSLLSEIVYNSPRLNKLLLLALITYELHESYPFDEDGDKDKIKDGLVKISFKLSKLITNTVKATISIILAEESLKHSDMLEMQDAINFVCGASLYSPNGIYTGQGKYKQKLINPGGIEDLEFECSADTEYTVSISEDGYVSVSWYNTIRAEYDYSMDTYQFPNGDTFGLKCVTLAEPYWRQRSGQNQEGAFGKFSFSQYEGDEAHVTSKIEGTYTQTSVSGGGTYYITGGNPLRVTEELIFEFNDLAKLL